MLKDLKIQIDMSEKMQNLRREIETTKQNQLELKLIIYDE